LWLNSGELFFQTTKFPSRSSAAS